MVVAAVCALALLLSAGVSSAQAPLVSYLTSGKIKVSKTMRYQFVCSVNCSVVETTTLKLGSQRVPTVAGPATFAAGAPIEAQFIIKSNRGVSAVRHDAKKAKLISSVTATDVTTGAQQTINRTFKLKK